MNGVRARLPELLLWLLGLGGVAVTTALIRSADWLTGADTLDTRVPLLAEVALATQAVAPTVVTAGLAVLLVRAGHRALATALCAIWICIVGAGIATTDGVWWILGTDVDGNPEPRPVAVIAATTLAILLGPLVLARRAGRGVPASPRRDVLPALLGLVALGVAYAARSEGPGEAWALPAIGVAVTAALVADRRHPDVVALAHVAGLYLAWRLVILGLARPEGLGSATNDVILLVVVAASAALVRYGPGALAAIRRVTSRGPNLWGASTTERTADAGTAPTAPTSTPAPVPVRALAAAAAAALAATGVVAWVAHGRSDGVVARRLAEARADIDTLDGALPAGWRIDPTGTACGSGEWSWCATTDASPAEAARVAADALAAAGRNVGKVTCPDTRGESGSVVRAGAPIVLDPWSDPCVASRRDGDVGVAVVAVRTLTSVLGRFPAVPQNRTAVAVGAWSNRDDAYYPDGGPWPVARREQEIAGLPALLAPAGWRATFAGDAAGTEARDPAPTVESANNRDRTLQVRVVPPKTITAAGAVAQVGTHLLGAGFRVEVAGCGDRGCRILADRWALPDRTGPEFVMGRTEPDGTVVLSVSLQ